MSQLPDSEDEEKFGVEGEEEVDYDSRPHKRPALGAPKSQVPVQVPVQAPPQMQNANDAADAASITTVPRSRTPGLPDAAYVT